MHEALWCNFLKTINEFAVNQDYAKKILIVVTDGGESRISNTESFAFCSQTAHSDARSEEIMFEDFYDDVFMINLGGSLESSFFKNAEYCGYYIEDGKGKDNYISALNLSLEAFKQDYPFIIWLAIISAIAGIFILAVPPRRNVL